MTILIALAALGSLTLILALLLVWANKKFYVDYEEGFVGHGLKKKATSRRSPFRKIVQGRLGTAGTLGATAGATGAEVDAKIRRQTGITENYLAQRPLPPRHVMQ